MSLTIDEGTTATPNHLVSCRFGFFEAGERHGRLRPTGGLVASFFLGTGWPATNVAKR